MKDPVLICNDDGIQMIHHCVPGNAKESVCHWVDFFLQDCGVDIFSFCTARPDKTHHETIVGQRDFDILPRAPAQSQVHYKGILDEFREAGTDILHVVQDQVHARGKKVVASIRMSDVHHQSDLYSFMAPRVMTDHPEWRIRKPDGSLDVALDYAHEGVRQHRIAIIKELIESYELDGLELDFMRSCRFFSPDRVEEGIPLMNAFIGEIRELLDRKAAEIGSERLLLLIRVPPEIGACGGLGLDPSTWVANGWPDALIPSDFMWLDYGTHVEGYAEICRDTNCGVYPCVNPFAAEWVDHRAINGYATNPVNFNRRVFFSDEQIRGLLRNYRSWGADGVYTFNFCCETIDNPEFVKRVHTVIREDAEKAQNQSASYLYLPIWRSEKSPSGIDQTGRTLRFGSGELGQRQVFRFRIADGLEQKVIAGRMRFRVYNLHDDDLLQIDLNGMIIADAACIERRKTNIHVAADRRYPGMHIPPHIAFEFDLAKCPPMFGDNEMGLTLLKRNPIIDNDCMMEALEIDFGWNGFSQAVGYVLED
jgi:hypothetical protein